MTILYLIVPPLPCEERLEVPLDLLGFNACEMGTLEVLYELPREVWGGDIDGAQNFAERLPTEGDAALVDTLENPIFTKP